MILAGALELGGFAAVITILLLIETMIAFGFFLWVGHKVFFGKPSAVVVKVERSITIMHVVILILAVLCAVVHLFAIPLIQHIPLGM